MTKERRVLTSKQVDEIADRLRGQCVLDIDKIVREMSIEPDDLTLVDYQAIDDEVFLCCRCGWWDDLSEIGNSDEDSRDELYCLECAEGIGC